MPLEFELVKALGCSRYVLRGALQALVNEGVITRVRGSGTYAVAYRRQSELDRLRGYQESRPADCKRASHRALECRIIPATKPVAVALDIELGEPVVFLERLAHLDDEPVCLLTHWLPAERAGGLLELDLGGDYYALLERGLGLRLGRGEATVDAVNADRGTAALLGVAVGAPLLFIQTITSLDGGRPIDLVCTRMRPDRMVLASTMHRPSGFACP